MSAHLRKEDPKNAMDYPRLDYGIVFVTAKGLDISVQYISRREAFERGEDAVCSGLYTEARLTKNINGKWVPVDADAEYRAEFNGE